MLNVKLPYLERENEHRRTIAGIYDREINNESIIKPSVGGCDMVWHQYVVRCAVRDLLRDYLSEAGVATDIHYAVPPHRQPCMAGADYGVAGDAACQAEEIGETVLSLPISSCTTQEDAHAIADIINRF